jgi:hypothetical protein
MGHLGREVYCRKLARYLSQSIDEDMISLISAVVAVQSGHASGLQAIHDLPGEALGAELGSPHHIPPWSLETSVNELLAIPKPKGFGVGRTRLLNAQRFQTLRVLQGILIKLENAEDGIFLTNHDVFCEMARIAQRQFPWQRGVANAPHLYRSILLYGTGSARDFFEDDAGIAIPDFVKVGACFSGALAGRDYTERTRDLTMIGITPKVREAALARLAISHGDARVRAARMRRHQRHTGYSPSILRDFPIIAFGSRGERRRAPIPELIMYRYTTGLYLDVVRGGAAVWTEIGKRFETYVLGYLDAMMAPYHVSGEVTYGPKKAQYRTPDILVTGPDGIVGLIECKAKRMSFAARYADDPVSEAAIGFDELAKGIFQLWRFFAHARCGWTGTLTLAPDCQPVIVTADSRQPTAGSRWRATRPRMSLQQRIDWRTRKVALMRRIVARLHSARSTMSSSRSRTAPQIAFSRLLGRLPRARRKVLCCRSLMPQISVCSEVIRSRIGSGSFCLGWVISGKIRRPEGQRLEFHTSPTTTRLTQTLQKRAWRKP